MMSAEISSKRPLTQLNSEIEQLEAESSRLERERAAIAKEVRRRVQEVRYLRLARWVRKPAARFELWSAALLVIGGGLVGLFLVVVVGVFTASLSVGLLSFLCGFGVGAALFAALLHRPPDALLPSVIAHAEHQARLANARLKEKIERATETTARVQRLIAERRDQIATGKLQRAALLQRNWKAMRGAEWEDYLVEVLRTHGATVERTARVTDRDANLIVEMNGRRVAVLTEGEGNVLNSTVIQAAVAARDRHRCDSCAVIINRRFTGGAQDFAGRSGCVIAGTGEFPDFVMGKLAL